MNCLATNISGALANPARRRFWLTIGSGSLIAVGRIARHGFEMIGLWCALRWLPPCSPARTLHSAPGGR